MPTFSQSRQSPETLVDAPFYDTRADVILRSSDGVDFRVFRIILSLASPIFADMFSIPQPPANELHAGPPVVAISEDSKALDFVLRHLYPVEHPTEIKLRDACILIEFARKYEVKALGPVVARSFMDAIESDPTGVYAIAVTYEEADIAIRAARSSLKRPISHLEPSQLQSPRRCCTSNSSNIISRAVKPPVPSLYNGDGSHTKLVAMNGAQLVYPTAVITILQARSVLHASPRTSLAGNRTRLTTWTAFRPLQDHLE
jgi:hypothetical protein